MIPKKVKVFAPATIANIGPGFDVLGVALEQPGDIVIAERQEFPEFTFSLHHSNHATPSNQKNVAAHVARLMLDEFKPAFGISLELHKQMPIGSGLGSSGASCAAAALAVNALLAEPLAKNDLVRFAIEGERLASGAAHADNVTASLLGGVCLIRSYNPLDIIEIPVKNKLFFIVAHPHIVVETASARDLLPQSIPLHTAIEQWGNLAGLISGFILGKNNFIEHSLKDCIAEPLRAKLIPGFDEVKRAAIEEGALGFSISGSGPSVFAIATSAVIAKRIAKKIESTFLRSANLQCDIFISRINKDGAKILE